MRVGLEPNNKKERDWQTVVKDQLTPVGKLVHLAMRQDLVAEKRIADELFKAKRKVYEQELTLQASRAGCKGQGRLQNNRSLTELRKECDTEAAGIVSTYNFDLAISIMKVRQDTPRANRHTYASRLRKWERERNKWKAEQITGYTAGSARARAQKDFYRLNNLSGQAELTGASPKCPICQGWKARGRISLKEAMNNPPPYHPDCPHRWKVYPEQVDDCSELWLGA